MNKYIEKFLNIIQKKIVLIRFIINLLLSIIGYILSPLNLVLIFLKSRYREHISDNDYSNSYFSIKFNAERNLKKILKKLNMYDASGIHISEKELKNSYFGIFRKKDIASNELIILIIPEYTTSIKNIWINYKRIKTALSLNKNIRIVVNRKIKYMFWVILFYKKIIVIKNHFYHSFFATILLNSPIDKEIDQLMIPTIALMSNRFYCYYTKYIADNFPWINFIKSDDDFTDFNAFPKWVDNFGYDEILHMNLIGHEYINDENTKLFKKELTENFTPTVEEINLYSIKNNDDKIAIVFPIYENWLYLKCRSFKSCLYNKSFANLEFYFIQDGSKTKELKNNLPYIYIKSLFKNIHFFKFSGGGSGSPARPRNKGVQLSIENKDDYLCFLDPDNSYIKYSVDIMLYDIKNNDSNICAYNMWTFGKNKNSKIESENKWGITKNNVNLNSYNNILEYYHYACFNMQQLIININWFKKNIINEHENTLGEDMIFWYELIEKNPKIFFYKNANSIYFNYQRNSLTNNVNEDFFIKSINCFNYIYSIFSSRDNIKDYLYTEFYKNYYNGILINWGSSFNINLLKELYDIFIKFDNHNAEKINSVYRQKIFKFFHKNLNNCNL